MRCCNAKGLFTGLINEPVNQFKNRKNKNKRNDALQSITSESYRFNIPRQKYTVEQLMSLGDGNTYRVLGDPVGEMDKARHFLLCECKVCGYKRHVGIQDLKNNKVNCDNCFRERLKQEAQSHGLTLIGDALSSTARRNYKFNDCGHEREIATADVRLGQFSCTECTHNKLLKGCDEANIEFIHKITADKVLVRFKACNHEKEVFRIHIVNGGSCKCQVCADEELNSLANSRGLDIIKYVADTRRLYRFHSCGHEKVISLSNMKSGRFSCEICFHAKMTSEAIASGLEYIGKASNRYHTYKAPCGCVITHKPAHIRVGHWTCPNCEKGFREFPNKLYLFKFVHKDLEWIKFGYSKNPKYRKYDYKLIEGVEHELLVTHEFSTGALAIELEKAIHDRYKEFNICKTVMKGYMTESGFTETYPIELLPQFLAEFTKLKETNE